MDIIIQEEQLLKDVANKMKGMKQNEYEKSN